MLDDGLTWKEQVVNVRRKCFAGQAKLDYFVIFFMQTPRGRFIMQLS